MVRTRPVASFLVCIVAIATAFAGEPRVKAKLTVDGNAIPLKHVYAFTSENAFDDKKVDVMVLFTDEAVPDDAIEHNSKLRHLASEGRFRGVLVSIDDERRPYSTEVYEKSVMHQGSGNGLYVFKPERFDRTRVAGTLETDEDKEWMKHKWTFAADFDTPVRELLTKPKGAALPADGGDPMKAYAAYQKALMSGDMKMLRRSVSADRQEQMNDPQFKEMLPIVQSLQPKNVAFVSGTATAAKAVLSMTGSNLGETMSGTITMVFESGQWKVAEESWRSKSE